MGENRREKRRAFSFCMAAKRVELQKNERKTIRIEKKFDFVKKSDAKCEQNLEKKCIMVKSVEVYKKRKYHIEFCARKTKTIGRGKTLGKQNFNAGIALVGF